MLTPDAVDGKKNAVDRGDARYPGHSKTGVPGSRPFLRDLEERSGGLFDVVAVV